MEAAELNSSNVNSRSSTQNNDCLSGTEINRDTNPDQKPESSSGYFDLESSSVDNPSGNCDLSSRSLSSQAVKEDHLSVSPEMLASEDHVSFSHSFTQSEKTSRDNTDEISAPKDKSLLAPISQDAIPNTCDNDFTEMSEDRNEPLVYEVNSEKIIKDIGNSPDGEVGHVQEPSPDERNDGKCSDDNRKLNGSQIQNSAADSKDLKPELLSSRLLLLEGESELDVQGANKAANEEVLASVDLAEPNVQSPQQHLDQSRSNLELPDYIHPPPGPPPPSPNLCLSGLSELPPPHPPTYQEVLRCGRLTFIDFSPKCVDNGRILTAPKYEKFDVLVAKANIWLKRHPDMFARCLETVEYKTDKVVFGSAVDTKEAVMSEVEDSGGIAVKCLRMWVGMREVMDGTVAQQVGYLNVVPACLNPGGITKKPDFDSLDTTLDKLNCLLRAKPLPGTILNSEAFHVQFREYRSWVDPDRCHYREYNELATSYLLLIRIFYSVGSPTLQEIGVHDLIPEKEEKPDGQLEFETLDHMMLRMNKWLKENPDVRLTNLQSVRCKVKCAGGEQPVDPCKSLLTSYRVPSVLQVLRVWYTRKPPRRLSRAEMSSVSGSYSRSSHVERSEASDSCSRSTAGHELPEAAAAATTDELQVKCFNFCPHLVQNESIFGQSQYEGLAETRRRITDWINFNAGLDVISAETALVKVSIERQQQMANSLRTYFPKEVSDSTLWLHTFRVYVWGSRLESARPSLSKNKGKSSQPGRTDVSENPAISTEPSEGAAVLDTAKPKPSCHIL